MKTAVDRRTGQMPRRALLVGLAGLVGARAGRADIEGGTAPSIIVAIAEAAAPVAYQAADGRLTGMNVDAPSAVAGSLGWTLEFVARPWARAQELVREGLADAHVTIATETRRRYMRFAAAPLFILNNAIIHFSSKNPRADQIRRTRSKEDLRSLEIAVTLGNSWTQGLFEGWPNLHATKDDATTLMLIENGRADVALCSREVFQFYVQSMGMTDLESMDASFLPGGPGEFRFGLRSNFQNADSLIERFDARQTELTESGALARILAKYT